MPNLVLASLFVLLWLSLRALASEGSVPGGLRQRRSAEDEKIPPVTQDWMCRLTVIGTMLERTGHNGELRTEGVEEYGCIPYEHGQETNQLIPITLPESFVTNHQEEIAYGRLIVLIHGASLVDDEVLVADQATFEVQEASHIERHLAATTGTLSLYVVRVSTPDATPSKTLSQLLQGIFSTSAVSFKSQYEACSFRKLSWKSAGGIDVKLDNKISSYSKPSQLVEAAVAKVEKATGRTISSLGNKVVFCQPPGLGGWIAVGVVNSWRVNINDGFCLSLSTLMHEVGHTLGLLHSGALTLSLGVFVCGSLGKSYIYLFGGFVRFLCRRVGRRIRRRDRIHGVRISIGNLPPKVLQRLQELVRIRPVEASYTSPNMEEGNLPAHTCAVD